MARCKIGRRILFQVCAVVFLSNMAVANEVLQAARSGNVEALAAALAKDEVDPSTLGRPLFFAAQSGHVNVVSMLLESGADPNTVLDFGSPLQKAARSNHVEVVGLLLQGGADPNLTAGEYDQTPLHNAAERGALEAARLLLEKGANVNVRDKWGLPPIHLAVRKEHQSMAAFLTEHGASERFIEPIASGDLEAADKELGRVSAISCTQCHQVEPGTKPTGIHNQGPSLTGVVNRAKGGVDGFAYSLAMKEQSGDWTPEDLNRFLADPPGVVPGTHMELIPELSREERIALIAYLSQL